MTQTRFELDLNRIGIKLENQSHFELDPSQIKLDLIWLDVIWVSLKLNFISLMGLNLTQSKLDSNFHLDLDSN